MLLAHVVQRVMRPQPIQSQDLCELEFEIDRHSARRARAYLAQMRSRVGDKRIEVRTAVLGPGDPRTVLAELAIEEQADLIVMSSHGATNMNDVACGSVAEYLIDQTCTALLVVRQ
ncbi:MAG: universal stress protein, partial [Porphyrobacter sp.]|nr:universal stress protein [Porphyrobacter sp.]